MILAKNKRVRIRIYSFAKISYIEDRRNNMSMETDSQSLSREIRNQAYSCVFCESVWKRLQEGELHNSLEELYLEHMKKYHGLTV